VCDNLNRFLARLLTEHQSFIDCGANYGWVSIPLAMRQKLSGGRGRVLAIEASPDTAKVLSKSAARNDLGEYLILANTFVGQKEGTIEFYSCTASNISSAYLNEHIKDAVEKHSSRVIAGEVPCTTVDSLVGSYKLASIGAIKIDVEGAELSVLKGCEEVLQREPNLVFIVEVNPVTLSAAGSSIREIWDFFTSRGFQIFGFARNAECRLTRFDDFDEGVLSETGDIVTVRNPQILAQRLGANLTWT
jgi:FkbM family methyltransferase